MVKGDKTMDIDKLLKEITDNSASVTIRIEFLLWYLFLAKYGTTFTQDIYKLFKKTGLLSEEKQFSEKSTECGADMRDNTKRKGKPREGNNESYNCENWVPGEVEE